MLNWLDTITNLRLPATTRGRGGGAFDIRTRLACLKQVTHFHLLRLKVLRVVRIRFTPNRYLLNHLDAVTLKTDYLFGIVCKKPKLPDAEVEQDLRTKPVIAQIHRETEFGIRLDR